MLVEETKPQRDLKKKNYLGSHGVLSGQTETGILSCLLTTGGYNLGDKELNLDAKSKMEGGMS